MARFSIVFAAAGVLLLVAMVTEASTVITTTTFEENPYGPGRTESGCYQQIMEQEMLSHCGMYLMTNLGQTSQFTPRMREMDHKQLCCMQLKNLGEQCMCPGIKMMLNQPMWSMMGQSMGQVANMAQNLPTECNLMSQPCQMRAAWF